MKIVKRVFRCAAIVQPGEYMIDRWDGQQCSETNPRMLHRCEHCGKDFCLVQHWHMHIDEIEAPF